MVPYPFTVFTDYSRLILIQYTTLVNGVQYETITHFITHYITRLSNRPITTALEVSHISYYVYRRVGMIMHADIHMIYVISQVQW